MRNSSRALLAALSVSFGFAQLTMDQKIADFQAVAALYDKHYGPYEWKRDALGFDLLNIAPWLTQIAATKNDLDFYEVMVQYVASLNDAHDYYQLPATFVASLNFFVDIYDGKLLVDTIDRTRLPASEFPIAVGYELVSIDGTDAQKVLDGLLHYDVAANPRSTRRLAAELLTIRPQAIMPHAADVPDASVVVFRRDDGNLESYRVPWTKSGLRLTSVGRYTTPGITPTGDDMTDADNPPDYMQVLQRLQNCRLPDRSVRGFGAQLPIFAASLPSSFVLRQGKSSLDPFFSGVFDAGGYKIGFIRIPTFEPSNLNAALTAFANEIVYFSANTDGLIVDEMRNPGGLVSYDNAILSLLLPTTWRSIPFAVRATSEFVTAFSSSLVSATAQGAPQSILDLLKNIKDEVISANAAQRGMTNPIPLDNIDIERPPATDSKGTVIAYKKPLMVLVDELTASGGDAFAATIQDNARGPLFGWRTMGAGGSVETWEAGTYSLGFASVTESLMVRKNPITTPDYPTTPYVENVGVRPDIEVDYMTLDNLMNNGKSFVDAFTKAMVSLIQAGK